MNLLEKTIKSLFAKATSARKGKQPIEVKNGKKCLPDDISRLQFFQDFVVKEAANIKKAQFEHYAQAEADFYALIQAALDKINELTGDRMTLDDPIFWETLDGTLRLTSAKSETPRITEDLVEAKKLFSEFAAKYFVDDDKAKPMIKIASRTFRSIDQSIVPKPADIKAFSEALSDYSEKDYPEIVTLRAKLANGWKYHYDKRRLAIKERDSTAETEQTLTLRGFLAKNYATDVVLPE